MNGWWRFRVPGLVAVWVAMVGAGLGLAAAGDVTTGLALAALGAILAGTTYLALRRRQKDHADF